MTGYLKRVYFIRPVGQMGPIKIGCSNAPVERLESFASWSPAPLEIIGSVPGSFDDENFLHRCFADLHSHREWFRPNDRLLSAIETILCAGSVDAVRAVLKPVGVIRAAPHKKSAGRKRCSSYMMKVIWTEKRLRSLGERSNWVCPQDVHRILDNWSQRLRKNPEAGPPDSSEMERVEEYLADPATHSIAPNWRKHDTVFQEAAE